MYKERSDEEIIEAWKEVVKTFPACCDDQEHIGSSPEKTINELENNPQYREIVLAMLRERGKELNLDPIEEMLLSGKKRD